MENFTKLLKDVATIKELWNMYNTYKVWLAALFITIISEIINNAKYYPRYGKRYKQICIIIIIGVLEKN